MNLSLKIIFTCIIMIIAACSKKERNLDGTYHAFFYETEWKIHLMNDEFIYESFGHLSGPRLTGNFKISGDTIILITDSTYYYTKFLIDKDSCLIDVEIQCDYCKTRPNESWGSTWRDINYPQIQTNDSVTIKNVLWMLHVALNDNEILQYFPDSTKSIVVQEYFELNDRAKLNIKSHSKEITILSEAEIKRRKLEEYLIVKEVRIGTIRGEVILQVMPEFSTSILRFFGKENGQWEMDPIR